MTTSCTAVLIPSSGSSLQSRIFLNLAVSSSFVSNRSGVNSILVGSLLVLLRQAIAMDNRPSDYISQLIVGALSRSDNIHVATTGVPTFGNNFQDPLHGYQNLGPLMEFKSRMSAPPLPADIVHNQELLALYASNPVTQSFLEFWGRMGVQCNTHFVIIFFKPTTTASLMYPLHSRFSLDSPPSIPSSIGPSSAAGSWDSAYQAPPLSAENMCMWNLITPGDASPQSQSIFSQEESPVHGSGVSLNSNSHLSGNNMPLSHLPLLHTAASDFIRLIRNEIADITEDALTSAKYNNSAGSLLGMVVNHGGMVQILDRFGLWGQSGFSDMQTVTFQSGQVFSSAEFIKQFGWSPDSFRHKSTWYGWAEVAAMSFKWNAAIPCQSFCSYLMNC
jgi:hypothetical protein